MNNKIRFQKIKVNSENKIVLEYEQQHQGEQWDEFTMKCCDAPRPEFHAALAGLLPHVLEMLELPKSYGETMKVSGVSFSYGGEQQVMGATITAKKTLRDSNAPLVLNTPHKPSESYSGSENDENVLTPKCVIAIEALVEEARKYLAGERAQGTLFKAA